MTDTLHKFQPTIVALLIFLAVLVYCLFNRYDAISMHNGGVRIIDHLCGVCLRGDGSPYTKTP